MKLSEHIIANTNIRENDKMSYLFENVLFTLKPD